MRNVTANPKAARSPQSAGPQFLSGLTAPQCREVLLTGKQVDLLPPLQVYDGGDLAEHFFLIDGGCLRLFYLTHDGRKVSLFWLTKGDVFGAAALLPSPSRYLASAEVVRQSVVRSWPRETIRRFAARYPALMENALKLGLDYLTWYGATHLALICHPAKTRLAQVLLTLSEGIGERNNGAVWVKVTNEELAHAASINLFTASRIMADWKKQGLIARARGGLLLSKPEELLTH